MSLKLDHLPTYLLEGDSTAEGLQQPLSKPQDIALRLEDRLKAAAAEEPDILQRALNDLPGRSLPR